MVDDKELEKEDKDLQAVLADELNNLSLDDRNLVQEELHCCGTTAIKETPRLLEQSLLEIRQRTTKIVLRGDIGSKEFRQTFLSNLRFLHCSAVCIKYLRVDYFRAEAASTRMVNHFELLFRYFGLVALQRPLRFSDLDKEEQDVFRGGAFQTLPCRDKAGRLILIHQGSMEGVNARQRLRVAMFNHCVVSEDLDSQKHGIVIIFAVNERVKMFVGNTSHADLATMYRNLPFRMAANHQCMPSGPAFQFIKAFWIIALASQDQRIRTKFHGELNQLKTQYELMAYGIPVAQLPFTHTGNVKIKNQLQWVKTRIAIDDARQSLSDPEEMYSSINIIAHPGRNDVLFSRGGNLRHHGNVLMREDIDSRLERFKLSSDAAIRQLIRHEVMSAVTQRGGRFLALNKGGWWEELSDEKTHEKITTAFYDCTKRKKIQEGQQALSPPDTANIFLSSNKRQKIGVVPNKGGCGCAFFHDPYNGGKVVNPFVERGTN